MSELAFQTLNGIAFGMLLFLLASGLTVIFGLMRVINLSHGALYLLGGYLALLMIEETGSWALALLVPPLAVGALALVLDRLLRERLYGDPLGQVLLTIGIALIIGDLILAVAGGTPRALQEPSGLQGSAPLPGGVEFPVYRLAIIGLGLLVAVGLGLLWERTRLGAILRAGVDDAPTLDALGIDVRRVFTLTFAAGAALAGLAGVLGAPYLGLSVGLDFDVLLLALVVVVVGGLGSLRGAFVGSLVIGLTDSFAKAYVPELSYFAVFAPVIVVLALRPRGLFGTAQA